MEKHRLEKITGRKIVSRLWISEPHLSDTFNKAQAKHSYESPLRENCTTGLSGGRRQGFK